jgi:hypothetical protein
VNRGWIHEERRQRLEAEKDWRSAIRNDPNHAVSRGLATFLQMGSVQEFEKGQLEKFRSDTLTYSF